jgi:hypothetical protein
MTREEAFQRFMDAQDVARAWSRSHAEKPQVLLDWLRDTERAWREAVESEREHDEDHSGHRAAVVE